MLRTQRLCDRKVGYMPATRLRRFGTLALTSTLILSGRSGEAQGSKYTVSGNQILDAYGNVFYVHGVDRSSYEYSRIGDGHFTQADFDNIANWNANTVRIATNQSYLLSDSPCYDTNYLGRLDAAVTAANNDGLNVIFDLHWNDGGDSSVCANGQKQMADARSLAFWQIMAGHFQNNPTVFFELYNEPHGISWDCWLNGCDNWVGMQQLYDTVRNAGFANLVVIGGLGWAYDLSGVPTHRVNGSNLVYATHVYCDPPAYCDSPADWPRAFGFLTATDPVIATEFGDFDCSPDYVFEALDYFDSPEGDASRRMGWTGWAWNSPGNCRFPSIIVDWNGTPSTMGQPEYDRLRIFRSEQRK